MIIIVEGPDGAGKTTRIDQLLASHPGSVYRHFSNPKTDEEAFGYWKVYAQNITNCDPTKLTVFDRSWYSDVVYGPIFRDRVEMDLVHVEMLESLVITHGGGFVLYCTAPTHVLWKRCQERGEKFVLSREKLNQVAISYADVMKNNCKLPCMRVDTNAAWQ